MRTHRPRARLVPALAALLILARPAVAQITGTLELDGATVGAGQGPRDHAKDYSSPDKVTITYTIATKMVNGAKVFDPANSKIVMKSAKWKWSTVDIPLTDVQGDPATGKITGFKFDAPAWYKNAPNGLVDKGIKGSVTIDGKGKGSGTIEAKYEDKTGKTKSGYTFSTDPPRPAPPKAGSPRTGGKPLSMSTAVSPTHSVAYDAATGLLSIHGDAVVGTPLPNDPILGAALTFPDYAFTGFNDPLGLAVFWAVGDPTLTMSTGMDVFQRSALPVLFYDMADNLFFGRLSETTLAGMSPSSPFYDPALATDASPFLDAVAAALDPASPYYDPFAGLFMTMTPATDFAALTAGFTASGEAGAVDTHLVSTLPEPASSPLVAAGLAHMGLVILRHRAVPGKKRRGGRR
jgi:hypothetical protein